jgi:hypothetical protein
MILAIDPGTSQSGWCIYEDGRVLDSGVDANKEILHLIRARGTVCGPLPKLAIEMIASYGMAVGKEVFETCVWIGRFVEAYDNPDAAWLIYRREVKLHLCGTTQAKDANIRQALLDMFPATGGGKTPQVGTKGQPGPLFGVTSHAWSALGVAVTAQHVIDKAKFTVPVRVADPLEI